MVYVKCIIQIHSPLDASHMREPWDENSQLDLPEKFK